MLGPQTLSYAMHDSPVGLMAWMLERRRSWGDDSLCQTPQYRNNMRKYDPVHLCVFC